LIYIEKPERRSGFFFTCCDDSQSLVDTCREGLQMREVACAILVRDGSILLGRRAPHKSYAGCWDVIGGHLEGSERPEDALVREVREEVGVTPTRFASIDKIVDSSPEVAPTLLHFFVVTEWAGGDPDMRGDEHTEIAWFDIEAACQMHELALPQYRSIFRSLKAW
jgi:8-oxo-dGTP diphosphatase